MSSNEEEHLAKKRMRFTPKQRADILSAANKDSLTAKQVKSKFGVSMVTYYLWRRKAGLTAAGRGTGSALQMGAVGGSTKGLEKMIRGAVRERLQSQLPAIVRDEVQSYLDSLLAKAPGGRTRRRA